MNTTLKRLATIAVITAMAGQASLAASVGSKSAAYVGGTTGTFTGAAAPVVGTLDTTDLRAMTFTAADASGARGLVIPYTSIREIEYGQKAGRRFGAAVATSLVTGPIGLVVLLSKKRVHYVTVAYTGEDHTGQVAVFEIGKDIVRTTIAVIEARSGRKVQLQDDEARQSR